MVVGLFMVVLSEFWLIFDVWQKNDHKIKQKMKQKKLSYPKMQIF